MERFIKLHPTSPAFDYALYLQGVINFNDNLGIFGNLADQDLSERDQQAARDSYQSFKQLAEQFPSRSTRRTRWCACATSSIRWHPTKCMWRVILPARRVSAAVNRAQQTLHEFQQAPAAEEALALMAQSYDKLGLVELRDDAHRVLRQNFPNSGFVAAAPAKK